MQCAATYDWLIHDQGLPFQLPSPPLIALPPGAHLERTHGVRGCCMMQRIHLTNQPYCCCAANAAAVAAQVRRKPRGHTLFIAAAMSHTRKLKLPIPVTIITGALGVGKTTTICSLLQRKPATEVWCVIVNEFGAIGIDSVAIEASCCDGSAVVKQIAGGCMCCALSGPLSAAIAQIIRQVKPDRVLIEPSGLGHPAGALCSLL